jgi:hypothetical protein
VIACQGILEETSLIEQTSTDPQVCFALSREQEKDSPLVPLQFSENARRRAALLGKNNFNAAKQWLMKNRYDPRIDKDMYTISRLSKEQNDFEVLDETIGTTHEYQLELQYINFCCHEPRPVDMIADSLEDLQGALDCVADRYSKTCNVVSTRLLHENAEILAVRDLKRHSKSGTSAILSALHKVLALIEPSKLVDDPKRSLICSHGGCEIVANVLKDADNDDVALVSLTVMKVLCRNTDCRVRFSSLGACDLVHRALKSPNAASAEQACGAFANLLLECPQNASIFASLGTISLLLAVCNAHITTPGVAVAVCSSLMNLTESLDFVKVLNKIPNSEKIFRNLLNVRNISL